MLDKRAVVAGVVELNPSPILNSGGTRTVAICVAPDAIVSVGSEDDRRVTRTCDLECSIHEHAGVKIKLDNTAGADGQRGTCANCYITGYSNDVASAPGRIGTDSATYGNSGALRDWASVCLRSKQYKGAQDGQCG